MKGRSVVVFIIIGLFLSSSLLVSANTQKESKLDLPKSTKSVGRIWYVKNAFAVGNASEGRQFGPFNRMGIIKFDKVSFSKLKFFPIRWEFVDYTDVTAIVFGLNQDIPEGPFDFQRDWIRAIIFE